MSNLGNPEMMSFFTAAMSNLDNPELERSARNIFRKALHLHYIESLEYGDAVDDWLHNHGGWFRDNQETYDADVEDDPEDIMSTDPSGAVLDAMFLMGQLYGSLRSAANEAELDHIMAAQPGDDLSNFDGNSAETDLAALTLIWLTSMGLVDQPSPVNESQENISPETFNGQQNRIERVTGHQFTGTAHRLQ